MFVSFLILVIVGILTISITELSTRWDFLISWVPYCRTALLVAVVIFLIFVVVSIIKAIKK